MNDTKIGGVKKATIKDGKTYVDFYLNEKWEELVDDWREGGDIELYAEVSYSSLSIKENLANKEDEVLKVSKDLKNSKTITVLIELPHSNSEGKLNQKGLAGHTGIIIGEDYYDYGPNPEEPFYSDGEPWWDKADLTKKDIVDILNDDSLRIHLDIIGRVCLIDINITKGENYKIERWWIDKYNNLGTYSVIPFLGEQCTTNVRISIEECTKVFSNSITSTTQSPKDLLELLTTKGVHTCGENKGEKLTISKEFQELKKE